MNPPEQYEQAIPENLNTPINLSQSVDDQQEIVTFYRNKQRPHFAELINSFAPNHKCVELIIFSLFAEWRKTKFFMLQFTDDVNIFSRRLTPKNRGLVGGDSILHERALKF
uniref:Uncharacterized protein n=1 Tax=Romanomermis culicivorax TaxID=13658 RepID=A0A915HNN5_ROMCU